VGQENEEAPQTPASAASGNVCGLSCPRRHFGDGSGGDDPGKSRPLGASLAHCSADSAPSVVISAGAPLGVLFDRHPSTADMTARSTISSNRSLTRTRSSRHPPVRQTPYLDLEYVSRTVESNVLPCTFLPSPSSTWTL
jgi:hypothetical protein